MKNKKGVILKKEDVLDPKARATKELRQEIGKRIQEVRKRSGLTARKISEQLGITREALTQIETGRNNVNATMLWKLAGLLGCEVTYFFPPIPKEYSLTSADVARVRKIDERAAAWAKTIFNRKPINER
ncbi:MAG: helix-turn-helix transcriptional regulator [Candidatus Liptonbacteria bacterium]|nr:helix-turn-helix transcriptional regulator [Candidatus Liptonbacteria bacterium]